jgi:hypothetical protein
MPKIDSMSFKNWEKGVLLSKHNKSPLPIMPLQVVKISITEFGMIHYTPQRRRRPMSKSTKLPDTVIASDEPSLHPIYT